MFKKIILLFFFVCFGINLYAQFDSGIGRFGLSYKESFPKTPANNFRYSFRGENGDVMAVGDGSIVYDITKNQVSTYLSDYSQGYTIKGRFVSPNYYFLGTNYYYSTSTFFSFNFSEGTKEINASDKPASSFDLFDPNHAIKVGVGGEMIVVDRTTGDVVKTIGGPDPNDPSKKFTEDFDDVTTLQNGRGIIVGSNSTIYYTDDFSYFNKAKVNLVNENNFKHVEFAYYPAILKRSAQSVPVFALGYQAETYSYVVCRSTDDGATWDSVFASPKYDILNTISAYSNMNAIIGGYNGAIYYTKDGGDTWNKSNYDNNKTIGSITHVSADSAYAVGDNGLILLTTDGGRNWTQISDDNPGFSGVYFSSPSVGYAASITGFNVLSVYKTTNAGENWNVAYVDSSFAPSYAGVGSIFFIDDMTGFIAGSKFIKTTDGGIIWNEVNTGVPPDPNYGEPFYQDVYFVNNSLGFAVYRAPGTGDGAVKTTDGGTTWNPVNINHDKLDKGFVYFADENLGFISGFSTLYRTSDGGDNWDTLAVGANNQNLNSRVTFINSTTGFFGKKGQIFKTTNKGDSWTDAPIDNHSVPQQIQFPSDSIGYAICTTDTFGIPLHVIFKTTDGGNNWSDLTDKLPGSTGFQYLFFTDENTGYLAGSAGIIKTTTGGEKIATSVRQIANASEPSEFKLYQNYPNPFNPETTIRFEVPEKSKVELKVYDILGREVATLVNKAVHAGNYKISFNASGFASGVYFFRLQAGSFTNTKKMILLR